MAHASNRSPLSCGRSGGAAPLPLVTWEPWTLSGRGFSLRAIARGRYDGYARRAARQAASWGHPILLRFAHEMNGTWYPWGRGQDGNTPGIYKAAWRHLVRIFRSAGAANVRWVWTPNVDGGGAYPFRQYYPGNKWVSWVGLDGFNWARRGEWQSFTDLFGSSYDTLTRLSPRPVMIAETGSSQSGGDKPAWVSSALGREIPRFSRIRAVVWFSDVVSGVDFRVNSSRASLAAFRSGIGSPQYGLDRSALLSTPLTLRRSTTAPAPPSGGFGQPSFLYRHDPEAPRALPLDRDRDRGRVPGSAHRPRGAGATDATGEKGGAGTAPGRHPCRLWPRALATAQSQARRPTHGWGPTGVQAHA